MNFKYILLLLAVGCCQTWLGAQVTQDFLWVNEFHYDNMTMRGESDTREFVELIIHDDILADADALAKLELVMYTGGGVGMDENSPIGTALPYSVASKIYTEDNTFHPLNEINDGLLVTDGWEVCDVADRNYAVMSKEIFGIQDLSAGFALIYDKTTVVQLLSYEKSFVVANLPEAGAAAGMTTELIASAAGTPRTEDATDMANHSIYMTGTGNKYSDFVWNDPILNTPSFCEENSGQTIEDLPCLPPSITNPGDQTVCGTTYALPAIEGEFLSGTEAYYDDTQANNGQVITEVTSDMTVYIYDTNGTCDDEESFMVSFSGAIAIDPVTENTGCDTYTLPTITGTALTGNEAYYTLQNGLGIKFVAGDEITTSQTLFIYDTNGQCSAEETLVVTIIDAPTIEDIPNQNACDAFTFPAITGTNLTNAAYYTESGGNGMMFTAGQSFEIVGANTLFIYDDNGSCSTEQSFAINITPSPIIDSPMGTLEGCNELILPEIEGSNLGSTRAYYTMPNGQGDRIVVGTRLMLGMEGTYYAYDEVNGCATDQQFMVNINEFVPGHAGENQNISSGDDVAPFNVVIAATGDGTFAFQWQKSSDNFTFTDISGATMETFDEGTLTDSTYYRRQTMMTTTSNVQCADENPQRLLVAVAQNDALAVDLLDFSASAKALQTVLTWNTANENNASGYFVEWSTDGKDFVELGFVNAQNAAFANYEYTHAKPAAGRNYYRLRQLDNDGTSEYSNIITVDFQSDFANEINFFPNPSNGAVEVALPATYNVEQTILVEIYDVKGQFVQQLNLLNTNKLDLTNLAAGTYQVRLTQGDTQQLGQVVVQ